MIKYRRKLLNYNNIKLDIDYQEIFNSNNRKFNSIKRRNKNKIEMYLNGIFNKSFANIRQINDEINYSSNVLIVGGGEIGLGLGILYNSNKKLNIVSADIYCSENVDIICDCHNTPFDEKQFDLIVVQAVMQYMDPLIFINELDRISRQNCIIYFECPFLQSITEGDSDKCRYSVTYFLSMFLKYTKYEYGVLYGPVNLIRNLFSQIIYIITKSFLIYKIIYILLYPLRLIDVFFRNKKFISVANAYYIKIYK